MKFFYIFRLAAFAMLCSLYSYDSCAMNAALRDALPRNDRGDQVQLSINYHVIGDPGNDPDPHGYNLNRDCSNCSNTYRICAIIALSIISLASIISCAIHIHMTHHHSNGPILTHNNITIIHNHINHGSDSHQDESLLISFICSAGGAFLGLLAAAN